MKPEKSVNENARIIELTQKIEELRRENDLLCETIDNLNEFVAMCGVQPRVKLRIV